MRVATWNLNNRVGRVRFRPEAATAGLSLQADLIAFNEFFPDTQVEGFLATLAEGGMRHQLLSPEPAAGKANRVLIASRVPIQRISLDVPGDDIHLRSNVLAATVPSMGIKIVALRVPFYAGVEAPLTIKAWTWLTQLAASLEEEAAVMLGDFNVSVKSAKSRGGNHFRAILDSGWRTTSLEAPTYFSTSGPGSQIDHILCTRRCALSSAEVITRSGQFILAGRPEALSDHAAVMCKVTVQADS